MAKLAAEALAEDPRVTEAKRLLRETLRDHQALLTGIRPPDPELRRGYAETLARFAANRGASLYYPYLGSGMGRGALVELADGSVKYDFITGIGVHYMGHNHPSLLEAGVDAALENTVMQGNLQQNADSEELLRQLLAAANRKGAKMAHGFLTGSGAMANENALKAIFQKRFPAHRVLAFEHCFAGRTLALSQVTDKAAYRQGLPEMLAVDHVPFYDEARPAESTAEAVAAVKGHLARHPGLHACMIFELIQGEGGGYVPGTAEFFRALMQTLRAAGVAVLADEIQTFGRTSEYFAFQHFGLDEFVDAVTLGKLSQACATLIRAEYRPKPGLVSQTFTAPSVAIRSASVILRAMEEQGFLGPDGKIMRLGRRFTDKLEDLALRRPDLAAGPFGMGGMIAFTPLGGDPDKVARFLRKLFEAGVIGFIAGDKTAKARFLLPVGGVEESDIDAAFPILERVLSDFAAAEAAAPGPAPEEKGKA
ncbi:MAG TPA: aminotransferase class III-fold pyridoxal phosphate-dependent enzyme [Fibrobacteria bacterium]|nr:aminotransferase class III-fold pyridoxal phosphate-dependent enzyme [Fibrobacteria bacterium]